MLVWVLVNLLLTLLALAFVLLNNRAPHRLRFHVCCVALLCWLVPWSLVPVPKLPTVLSLDLSRVEGRMLARSAEVTQLPVLVIDTRGVPLASEVTLLSLPLLVLMGLLASGVALYGWTLLQHQRRLHQLHITASDGNELWQASGIISALPLHVQDRIAGAFTSGLWRPMVWLHKSLATTPELPALLRHELTHIQQHDNWYLLLITLVEKLYWWNPLVWYLARQTRQLQELSCDERCQHSNADYPAQLAQLMLTNLGFPRSTAPEPLLLSANIFNLANQDIQRLKVLQRSHPMKPRHIVSAVATAVLAIATVGLVTAQPDASKAEPKRQVFFLQKQVDADGNVQTLASGDVPPAGVAQPLLMGAPNANGGANQFVRMENRNGTDQISFSFTDVPLPMALGPLSAALAGPGAHIARFQLNRNGQSASQQQQVELQIQQGGPKQAANAAYIGGDKAAPLFADHLRFETEDAKTRQVTVSGENLGMNEALAAIAKASNCNIFRDGDKIVVDYCGVAN